jgi:hypothetical protein
MVSARSSRQPAQGLASREGHEGRLEVGAGRWLDLGAEPARHADHLVHWDQGVIGLLQ